MSGIDDELKASLTGEGAFDPARAGSAHESVFRFYNRKLIWSERAMWLQLYLLLMVGAYAVQGFNLQATTAKGWVGYGLVILTMFIITIQKTLLFSLSANQWVVLKEIKQMRLAQADRTSLDEAAARPLRGTSVLEKGAWLCGLMAVSICMALLGSRCDRQDDVWRLGPQESIEARSTVTLQRFPHQIRKFFGVTGPVEGAVLKSARLNGEPMAFNRNRDNYAIQLPSYLSWKTDKLELVWTFSLNELRQDGVLHAPLRSMMPVHGYSLAFYVDYGSGYAVRGESWKFNKSADELANESEARRSIKLFTQNIKNGAPRTEFGSCGIAIEPAAANEAVPWEQK